MSHFRKSGSWQPWRVVWGFSPLFCRRSASTAFYRSLFRGARAESAFEMALGARSCSVARMILRESAILAGVGVALGAIGSIGLARMAEALLYGVTSTDPVAFGITVITLATVAGAAAAIPAYRAATLDPAATLRSE